MTGNEFSLDEEEWRAIRDYADRVEVVVQAVEWDGTVLDEMWVIQSDGAAWERDWLLRRVEQLGHGGGCCGSQYFLRVEESRQRWGADATVMAFILGLAFSSMQAGVYDLLKVLAKDMAQRLSESGRVGWELSDDEAARIASLRVATHYDINADQLVVKSVETSRDSTATVEITGPEGVLFTVALQMIDGACCLQRVKRTQP
ncbi:hypothetical protein [Quadrisphaera sp. KR29]|uniref:hypothetical protein n=1 Tax=Quadrisphaera sp. KR29 TaxID=3461391 RepID=UPI004043C154